MTERWYSADGTMSRREYLGRAGMLGSSAILAAFLPLTVGCSRSPAAALKKVSIGVSPSLTATLEYVAQECGFFVEQGLDVEIRPLSSGIAGVAEMLDGKVTAASSTALPVMMQGFARTDFRIVATVASMANDNWLVTRRDCGISAIGDLKGKRVGSLKGGMPQFVLDLLLMKNNMTCTDIVPSFASPSQLIEALVQGNVEAVVLFGKYLDEIRERLGDNAVFFGDKLLTQLTSFLTMRDDEVRKNPETVEKLLRAYIRAERFVDNHPDKAMSIVAKAIDMDISKVRQAWPDCVFYVSLHQHQLSELEDKAAWAVTRGITPAARIPNFLNFFYCEALERIEPSRASVIHAEVL